MDLNSLAPKPTQAPVRTRQGKHSGPNPFLDQNWLADSYQNGRWDEVTVPGTVEQYEQRNRDGELTGKMATRYTGDALTVVTMLRQAADLLEIGVSIVAEQTSKTKVTVKYRGQARKQYNRGETEDSNFPPNDL